MQRRSRPARLLLPLLFALLASCACAAPDDGARARWLQHTLIEDNLLLMQRDPDLTGGKLLKMGASPYGWFRGSLGQFLRDQAQRSDGFEATAFGSPAGGRILLLGDPHLENIGTFPLPGGGLTVDFNDFDGATWGPWISDLRRLALSLWLVAADADLPQPDALAAHVARGYLAMLRGDAAPDPQDLSILNDLMEKAAENGEERAELEDYTALDARGRRNLRLGTLEPSDTPGVLSDVLRPLDSELREAITTRLPLDLPPTLRDAPDDPAAFFRVKDVAQRLGAGVSSYPVLRCYALVEGPTADPGDDLLLELKETLDPPLFPELAAALPPRAFPHNAARVVTHQRDLQRRDDLDPMLGWITLGPLALRVRDRTKLQRGLDTARILERLDDGRWNADDLRDLAFFSGYLLAAAHLRAPTLDGADAGAVLRGDVGDRGDALMDELRGFVERYGPRTRDDHRLLQKLLQRHGPRLGYTP